MNIVFAEAVKQEIVEDERGCGLCHARVIPTDSRKFEIINDLFKETSISYFLRIGAFLNHYLNHKEPLVIVTDWTDPTEMRGLRLETETGVMDYPDLHFLAFNTDWDDISRSGIEAIFAHEISHLWLSLLGFDIGLSKSNRFHTCTAITDPFMAFP